MTRALLFALAVCVLTLACHDSPTAPTTYQPTCLAWSPPDTLSVTGAPPGTVAIMRRCLIPGR